MSRLVADIGGTNARFALADADGTVGRVETLLVHDHVSFDTALEEALTTLGSGAPDSAAIAVAGPVRAGKASLTNGAWSFSEAALAKRCRGGHAALVNDFQAVASAIPHLKSGDLEPLGPVPPRDEAKAPRLALGPGTGLGAALLVPFGDRWRSIATEAGHRSLPVDDYDRVAMLRRVAPDGPPEAEAILSGPGIARLHHALTGADADSETITAAAAKGDPAAGDTIAIFTDLLAGFAAELVLSTGAMGGVYLGGGLIGGGVLTLDPARFRAAFVGRGRMAALLETVPSAIIRHPNPALLGLARMPLG